jgi:hypothetical protein
LITIDGPAGVNTPEVYVYCLRNVGSQTVSVTMLAEDMIDIETDCTGDENALSANGKLMVTGGPDTAIKVWTGYP